MLNSRRALFIIETGNAAAMCAFHDFYVIKINSAPTRVQKLSKDAMQYKRKVVAQSLVDFKN